MTPRDVRDCWHGQPFFGCQAGSAASRGFFELVEPTIGSRTKKVVDAQVPSRLLSDEQVRGFISDGFLLVYPSLSEETHRGICDQLEYIRKEEYNPGNNILARLPDLGRILGSPEVRGALVSLLGGDYFEHPHRFWHYTAGPRGALLSNFHQDSYPPLAQGRQHHPRWVRLMYYPQETLIEMGPTYLIPGSQYFKWLPFADRERATPLRVKAGTVCVAHFDIGHAAGINEAGVPRHMVKFIFLRGRTPNEPTWDCRDLPWVEPASMSAAHSLSVTWAHQWHWLTGAPPAGGCNIPFNISVTRSSRSGAAVSVDARLDVLREAAIERPRDSSVIESLVGMLNRNPQWLHVESIYTLAAIGTPAIPRLLTALESSVPVAVEDGTSDPSRRRRLLTLRSRTTRNEYAISMDGAAHALGSIGAPAIDGLLGLVKHPSDWVRANAVFAIGQMDREASSVTDVLADCLRDDSHLVVRTAAEALGRLGVRGKEPSWVRTLSGFLCMRVKNWDQKELRMWSPMDVLQMNSALSIARLGTDAAFVEEDLIRGLEVASSYAKTFAVAALRRIGTATAQDAILDFLGTRCWDSQLFKGRSW